MHIWRKLQIKAYIGDVCCQKNMNIREKCLHIVVQSWNKHLQTDTDEWSK